MRILFLLMALFVVPRVEATEFEKDLVPDESTAIKIASAVMEAYLGSEQFQSYLKHRGLAAELDDEEDEWIVCHCAGIENLPSEIGKPIVIPGFVGLTIMISRKNGEITYLSSGH